MITATRRPASRENSAAIQARIRRMPSRTNSVSRGIAAKIELRPRLLPTGSRVGRYMTHLFGLEGRGWPGLLGGLPASAGAPARRCREGEYPLLAPRHLAPESGPRCGSRMSD